MLSADNNLCPTVIWTRVADARPSGRAKPGIASAVLVDLNPMNSPLGSRGRKRLVSPPAWDMPRGPEGKAPEDGAAGIHSMLTIRDLWPLRVRMTFPTARDARHSAQFRGLSRLEPLMFKGTDFPQPTRRLTSATIGARRGMAEVLNGDSRRSHRPDCGQASLRAALRDRSYSRPDRRSVRKRAGSRQAARPLGG
jgi:hypothetical protein